MRITVRRHIHKWLERSALLSQSLYEHNHISKEHSLAMNCFIWCMQVASTRVNCLFLSTLWMNKTIRHSFSISGSWSEYVQSEIFIRAFGISRHVIVSRMTDTRVFRLFLFVDVRCRILHIIHMVKFKHLVWSHVLRSVRSEEIREQVS